MPLHIYFTGGAGSVNLFCDQQYSSGHHRCVTHLYSKPSGSYSFKWKMPKKNSTGKCIRHALKRKPIRFLKPYRFEVKFNINKHNRILKVQEGDATMLIAAMLPGPKCYK